MSVDPNQLSLGQQPSIADQSPITKTSVQSPFLSQATPGQPTIPPAFGLSPTGTSSLDIGALYNSLQNYYQPLSQPVQLTAPAIDDATTQALAQQFLALQQHNAVLNGSQPPDPNSVLAKASSHLTASEIAAQVGQQTWQGMITDPFNQFVDTWKTDPKAGLLETLGGVALVGGIIGLETLTAGAATPWIFAAGAALVAPGMASAWADELQHPTDSNLVKALVNTSTGILTVGVPVKWSAGMGVSRAGLESVLKMARNSVEPRGIPRQWITGRKGLSWADARADVPVGRQADVLADTVPALRRQYKRWGLSEDGLTDSGQLLSAQEKLDSYGTAWHQAIEDGDVESADEWFQKMEGLANGEYRDLRLKVSYNYNFLPSNPYKHVPFGATIRSKDVGAKTVGEIQKHLDHAIGVIDQLKLGNGLASSEVLPAASRVLEHHAASLSGNHPEAAINEITLAEKNIAQMLKISDVRPSFEAGKEPAETWDRLSDYEKVEVGLEDPKMWRRLSPQQQLYGQVRASLDNGLTVAELRHGTIGLPYAGRVKRIWGAANPEDDPVQLWRDPTKAMRGDIPNFSRVFKLAFDEAGHVRFDESRSRLEILADEFDASRKYDPAQVEFLRANQGAISQARRRLGGKQGYLTFAKKSLSPDKAKKQKQLASIARVEQEIADLKGGKLKDELLAGGMDEETAGKIFDHVLMDPGTLSKVKSQMPIGRNLVTGSKLFRTAIATSVYRLHSADYHHFYLGHAQTNFKAIEDAVLKAGQEGQSSALLQSQQFVEQIGGKPDFLPETAFRGGIGSVDSKADAAGYAQIAPAIGNLNDLHFRPAVYARKNLAQKIQDAHLNSYSSSELHTGLVGALYKTTGFTKHVIMLSPAWHFMNVAGRAIAFMLNDPALTIPALRTVFGKGEFLLDERLRSQLATEFSMNGGKRANQFNISRQVHLQAREETGQTTWPGVLRSNAGALGHSYAKHVEDGFWKMVDDLQLAAYQYAKYKLKSNKVNENEIGQLAALYANDIGGMVNPLYMNKLYRHMRNLLWFAPSYWATFTRSMLSLAPGADRLSGFLAGYRGGAGVRMSAVPLKAISEIGRREMVRMHRSWMITYLTTAVASADMLNVMLGGRHLWENDEGHMFDINVDKLGELPEVGKALGPQKRGSTVQHAYFSGMPFFRQAMDVANALGLGHDWGFGHQFGDDQFQQVNAAQKALLLAGGLMQGIKEQAASKTAAPLQAGFGLASGQTLSGFARGVQRKEGGPLGNFSALTAFIPGGSTVQRAMSVQGETPGQAVQSIGGSLLQQYTGLPTIYHLGVEEPPVDDDRMQSWVTQRNQIHDILNNTSKQMFAGQIQPIQYERLRQQSVDKLLQLNSDTFGQNTPTGVLSGVRLELERANGLDRNDLTDSEWAERNDLFQMEWDQALQNASPEARAAWWEAETSQWTDADYLVWEAQQMRQALMAAVDGQGGQHIRAYQHQIGPLLDIPSTSLRRQLEQGDPYYYTYRQLLKQVAQTSSLGAFINAFVSPYTSTMIEPDQLSPEQEAALADITDASATIIRPQTAQALAAEAKARAKSKAVTEAGGKAGADPGFQQELGQMVQEASS